MSLQSAVPLVEQLKSSLASNDVSKASQLVAQLKIQLAQLGALSTAPQATSVQPSQDDVKKLLLAREVLELGAQTSIKARDLASFERGISQLSTYYFDYPVAVLAASQRMATLLSLYLIALLSQTRIAEFHTLLERIPTEAMETNMYIQYAVKLEQYLAEGAYNKVWAARKSAPSEEFGLFLDLLVNTIRGEVAACAERAYVSLPLPDATSMLFCKDQSELIAFAQKRGWNVSTSEKKVVFGQGDDHGQQLPAKTMVRHVLHYARELERIV